MVADGTFLLFLSNFCPAGKNLKEKEGKYLHDILLRATSLV
jgi:hypothetical protein